MKAVASKDRHEAPSAVPGGWKVWPWLWMLGILGMLLLSFGFFFPTVAPPRFLTLPLGVLGCFTLSITIHELAHFFVGRWAGLQIWRLRIGNGRVVFEKDFREFRLVLGEIPLSGGVYPFIFVEDNKRVRWKRFLMVAAGPASNAAVLIVSAMAAPGGDIFDIWSWSRPISIAPIMAKVNVVIVLSSLIPYLGKVDGVQTASDGLNLVRLFLNRTPNMEGNPLGVQGNSSHSGPSWHWTVRNSRPEPFLRKYREYLNKPNQPAVDRHQVLDAFATCVLMHGAHDFLPEADRYSEELFKAKPDEWTVKGTRGSILVDKGDIEAGITMLQDVMKHDPSEFDRAICASFLAVAEIKRNNIEEALQWIRMARSLDSDCGALPRAESLLTAVSSTTH